MSTMVIKLISIIQLTTASSLCAVLDIVVNQSDKFQGLIKQEQISLNALTQNKFGNYNQKELGWNYQSKNNTEHLQNKEITEQRKWYETSTLGRLNIGHTFGDDLTEDERLQVLEYLKTL